MKLLGSLLSGRPDEPPYLSSQPRSGGPENRCHDRLATGCRITLVWQTRRGKRRSSRARVIDMNGTGALVKTGADLVPGSHVYVHVNHLGLMASALVRHSVPGLFTSKVGLHFLGSLMPRF